jgi:two-component system chemotaxis response regulator CheY
MSRRILIVHAAVVMRMIVKENLTAVGYEIAGEADNGREALEKYRALLPDIVTMDMVLAELDGVATVKAIVSEFPQALIIMCTSIGQPALLAEAMQAGAKAFVTKPFPPAKIVEAVESLLAESRDLAPPLTNGVS